MDLDEMICRHCKRTRKQHARFAGSSALKCADGKMYFESVHNHSTLRENNGQTDDVVTWVNPIERALGQTRANIREINQRNIETLKKDPVHAHRDQEDDR